MDSLLLSLLAFGFCEYGDPESTLRALRLLHDFKLGEKNLVVGSSSCPGPIPNPHSQEWPGNETLFIFFPGESGCENSQRSFEVRNQKEEHQKELASR